MRVTCIHAYTKQWVDERWTIDDNLLNVSGEVNLCVRVCESVQKLKIILNANSEIGEEACWFYRKFEWKMLSESAT